MAINQTEKRRALARNLAAKSAALVDILNQLDDLRQQHAAAGLTFDNADFEAVAGLQHFDASTANDLIFSIEQVSKFVRGESATTGNHITNLEKVRP